jgi:DNA-binding CsgD family transcriptional regulator
MVTMAGATEGDGGGVADRKPQTPARDRQATQPFELHHVTGSARKRRVETAGAAMTRAVRRRSAGYQRVDPNELRLSLTQLTSLFASALAGGPSDELHAHLRHALAKRLRQGLHAMELYGAWQEVRSVLELRFADGTPAVVLLDELEATVVDQLRKGVPLRAVPTPWPAQEVSSLRRALDRAAVTLELLEDTPRQRSRRPFPKVALTRREREILTLAASGLTNDRIAKALGLSASTVRTYVSRATEKLEAANRVHAVALGLSFGLISLPE